MITNTRSIFLNALVAVVAVFSSQAIAVDFTYDAEFVATNGLSNVDFPLCYPTYSLQR